MKYIAAYDIGTTAVKAVLVSADGEAVLRLSRDIPTIYIDERREQDPMVWWDAFRALSAELIRTAGKENIAGIIMSGQMQDVIPVDENGDALCSAILYSDGRGTPQARRLTDCLGAEILLMKTGNVCDGSLSLPKIMWLKDNAPDVYSRAASFLISSKDFVIRRLTGLCVGDLTACSTAGAMNLKDHVWDADIFSAAGVDAERMPRLLASHEQAGSVTEAAAAQTGFPAGTPVFAGVGDAGATTLAAGIMRPGQYNINLGTSGWVAAVSNAPFFSSAGVFNLAAMPEGMVINVVPFLNAGNVHHWVSALFAADGAEPDYARTDALLAQSVPGSNGIMALPYLVGERFPVLDSALRGAFVGVTPTTSPADMTRAMLEGVCFSIRSGIEQLETPPEMVSVIGGGGRVSAWCQMLADILNTPVSVFADSDTLPAKAVAAAAMIGLGLSPDYSAFCGALSRQGSAAVYTPDKENAALYERLYKKHLRLYPVLKEWYGSED